MRYHFLGKHVHGALNECRLHPTKVQPKHEMSTFRVRLMLFNPLNQIIRGSKPELLSLFQLLHLVMRMSDINAVMVVDKIAQHRLSAYVLRLSSTGSHTGIEDERERILAGVAACTHVVLSVCLRQPGQGR